MVSRTAGTLTLPVRKGRNTAAFVLLLVLTVLALYVAYGERDQLDASYWWVAVFPLLLLITGYRLVRPRVPIALDDHGMRVQSGHSLLGLRTAIEWAAIKRLRITAAGMLLIELRNSEAWVQGRPWLVRANVRANERKVKAAVVQPLRELAGTPAEIIGQLTAAAPVRVEVPEGMKGAR